MLIATYGAVILTWAPPVAWMRTPPPDSDVFSVTVIEPKAGFVIGFAPMVIEDPAPVILTGNWLFAAPPLAALEIMSFLTIISLPPDPPKFTRAPLTLSVLTAGLVPVGADPSTLISGPFTTVILLPLMRLRRSPVTSKLLPLLSSIRGPELTEISPLSSAITGPRLVTLLLKMSKRALPSGPVVSEVWVAPPIRLIMGAEAWSKAISRSRADAPDPSPSSFIVIVAPLVASNRIPPVSSGLSVPSPVIGSVEVPETSNKLGPSLVTLCVPPLRETNGLVEVDLKLPSELICTKDLLRLRLLFVALRSEPERFTVPPHSPQPTTRNEPWEEELKVTGLLVS